MRQAAAEYQTFDARRADGGIDLRGSVLVACLSCHDGSQAPDASAYTASSATQAGAPLVRRAFTRDHPVGMVYSGFRTQGASGSFESERLQRDVIGAQMSWWLNSEAVPDGIRDKTGVIFYTRGEVAGAEPFVECGSCHEPHANPGKMFLRVTAQPRNLCSTCHNL